MLLANCSGVEQVRFYKPVTKKQKIIALINLSFMQRRALMFDDDEDILSMCSYFISSLGWEVYTRSSCDDLFATLQTIKPSIIFMDNNISGFNGIAATKMIKSHDDFKSIPVVYFSANPEIRELAREAGADTYLEKPFNIKDLEKLLI